MNISFFFSFVWISDLDLFMFYNIGQQQQRKIYIKKPG